MGTGHVKAGIYLARILLTAAWWLAAWRWGDWRHWEKYHPTILYFIIVSLLENVLTCQHALWTFEPTRFFPSHTVVTLLVTFAHFPAVALLYLPHFPNQGVWKQIGYMGVWVGIFVAIEFGTHYFQMISYHNGWSFLWSVILDALTFPLMRLHQRYPLWAYALTATITIAGLLVFRIPPAQMR